MAYSDFGSTTSVRPDKPLIVKCQFDSRLKRITFRSSRNCSYDLLRAKVEECFALSATQFILRYKDDDGEITDVTSDGDLTEAIHYFQAGEDPPLSSASSILSGRSGSSRKVTLRLQVVVEHELSLSDTASLASLEEYNPNASDLTLAREPLNGYRRELEDDEVTVSSHDTSSRGVPPLRLSSRIDFRALSPVHSDGSPPASSYADTGYAGEEDEHPGPLPQRDVSRARLGSDYAVVSRGSGASDLQSVSDQQEERRDVFNQLREVDIMSDDDYNEAKRLSQSERGVQWLRDQNVRVIQSMIGALPAPSVTDGSDASVFERDPAEDLSGDLALQQDQRGRYYYTYTSSSGASFIQEEAATDILQDGNSVLDSASIMTRDEASFQGEPSPRGLAWIADQRAQSSSSTTPQPPHPQSPTPTPPPLALSPVPPNPFMDPTPEPRMPERYRIDPSIPLDVLQFIPEHHLPLDPPEEVTHCSSCDVALESFRYVCTTCGERDPYSPHSQPTYHGKGKGKDFSSDGQFSKIVYPPLPSRNLTPSSSSQTLLGAYQIPRRTSSLPDHHHAYLSPPENPLAGRQRHLLPQSSQDTLYAPPPAENHVGHGYELCSSCIESVGVIHALEGSMMASPMASPSPRSNGSQSSSEESVQTLSQLRRSAPRTKGQMRHAFREKVWGRNGWKDVEQDSLSECSICSASLESNRYKCVSCSKFDLCRACYSQVHEIHPSHAFLSIPDQSFSTQGDDNDIARRSIDVTGEPSLKHPGVKCHHCMQDIVGARFHCAVCDAVDICSNCESAGLPGNLTSPDGGHDSSHIMIKIPYPLASNEVETASRRAISLWHRDRAGILGGGRRRRSNSQDSAHAQTVIGPRSPNGPHSRSGSSQNDDHRMSCRNCGENIVGVRYQCAMCPSTPASYNLCEGCEVKSYFVHDPMHVFIKLPRPVDHLIQSPFPLLPSTLYSHPAGFIPGRGVDPRVSPKTYLQSLCHRAALCDRHVEHIRGIWLHCAYCGSDLCEECESLGSHDRTHVFFVFKAQIDMNRLREIRDVEDPARGPPLIPHSVYLPPS